MALFNRRADFPALAGNQIAFLDSAASAQKPRAVVDAMLTVMEGHYANIHRGLYKFSNETTAAFEAARGKIAKFIGAPVDEVVFTHNSTESINLVAQSWGRANLKPGDEVLLTEMEHHANLVPWHLLRDQIGIVIKYIPVLDGALDLSNIPLSENTKIVSFTHISNALGTINPAKDIIGRVRAYNPDIKILVDGSQSAVHMKIDVRDLGADFFVFTGHKLYGPTGVGVLWGKRDILNAMPPYQGGGDMIETVSLDHVTYKSAPARFEAGTPAIVEVIGLGAAVDYVTSLGWDAIAAHEKALSDTLYKRLSARGDLKIHSPAQNRAGIVSFTCHKADMADLAMILDQCNVAVRVGHHCCQPLMGKLGVTGTVRASLALYSTPDDINALEAGLDKAVKMLS
jgi:cysteine desulfurase/selenocysteine lyase